MMIRTTILAALLVPCMLLLAGCGGGEADRADLTFITGTEHHNMDPQRMSWMHDIRVADVLFEPLVIMDFGAMEIQPGVAERWETSEDGLTYTFHLREDARWSNGDPVTAHDFIYAWRRALTPDLAAKYATLLFHIDGAYDYFNGRREQLDEYARIAEAGGGGSVDAANSMWALSRERFAEGVGIEAVDERTLVVHLARPVPYFLELVAFATFMPVHAASLEPLELPHPNTGMLQTDTGYWTDPDRLVTNGPFRIASRQFRQGLRMVKNEHYWNREAVRLASIQEVIIANPLTALQAYNRGQADVWFDVPSASSMAAELAQQDRPDVHVQAMAGMYFYNFNCAPQLPDGRANPLADVRVRRALALAVDRRTIVERVTQLNQPIARSFVPPGAVRGYEPPVEAGISLDVEEARRLLAEAGYPAGEGLTGLSILFNTGAGHEAVAQVIQRMWQENLGVRVDLTQVESNTFGPRMRDGHYTIARAAWFGDYPDPTTWLEKMTTGNEINDARWSNERYDRLLAQAAEERDPQRRSELLREAEAMMLQEAPMALLYQYVNVYPIRETIRGLTPNAWGRFRLERAYRAE